MTPAISVIMAVHNSQAYLAPAIESILGQSFPEFEFIIINDGSTDQSKSILEEFGSSDSRIRIIEQPNRGLTTSLNSAIGLARAGLIARMDADDIAHPTRFEKQFRFLNQHPEIICVGTHANLIDPFGAKIGQHAPPLDHASINRDLMRGIGWSIIHPSAMIRKSLLEMITGYDERYRTSQDLDLFLKLAEVGQLANIPEMLLDYRQHFSSANRARKDEQRRLKYQIVLEAAARRGIDPPKESDLVHFTEMSRSKQHCVWGWAVLRNGKSDIARRHAYRAIRAEPTSVEAWKLMFCSLRGR